MLLSCGCVRVVDVHLVVVDACVALYACAAASSSAAPGDTLERFGNNSMWSLAVLNAGALSGMNRENEAARTAEDIGNSSATVVVLLECTEVHLQVLRSAEDMLM